jgi:NAD(P)H-dependent FMN reductase
MTGDAVAILGSARSNGNTAAVLTRFLDGRTCDVFDLLALQLAPFDYSQTYPPDAFLDVVRCMIAAPVVVFATPVYWYSMSAVMKEFVDRLSDLLMSQKDLGRQLRGRRFALLSSSEEPDPDPDLVSMFRRTCEYLGVEYLGCVHAKADGPFGDPEFAEQLRALLPLCESLPA